MPELLLPWLELSILIPLLGALLVKLPKNREFARRLCIAVCGLTLLCTLAEWADFSRMDAFEAHDHWDPLASIFHSNMLVIDELNAPLLPLVSLLFLLTVLSTLRTKLNRFSLSGTLLYEATLMATFSCQANWLLIGLLILGAVFPWWEMRFRRGESTRVYSIHMLLFAFSMVVGYGLLPADAENHPNQPGTVTMIAAALLTLGALLRNGIAPLHCWMTDLFERATLGTALLHVLPMTGAYAAMRLVLPIVPTWALQSIAVLSLFTAVYASGRALVETDTRKFFCYLLLSSSSLVLVGLELVTPVGLTGALCLWLSIGLSLGGLGLTLRSVEARVGRIGLERFHGLAEHMPTLAGLFLLTGLGSIGFPGTIGFIGAELLVEGAVEVYPIVGIAAVVAAAMNGIAIMHAYFRIFAGHVFTATISFKAKPSERFAVVVLALLIVGGGLYPQPGVQSRYHAAETLLKHRGPSSTVHAGHGDPQKLQSGSATPLHEQAMPQEQPTSRSEQ
ncbi:proton-conducting transporter transmembrane domain-containing protein [Aureliella helgolandensis]|uniref:NADH-quinone oxidoreductase subunit M n=1 Tax=Aureliella helgolandensis TaxID=2527968 RepID=A0A518G7E7_9BACT|nr:proton-conducting transporter membrane subunit [Aureliella helgolandensis]QDV24509.1 NADH-quinone oxidoreductase subunit M [Aureliella helgolandensis]